MTTGAGRIREQFDGTSTFTQLREALLRSLDRHVVRNDAVRQAFRTLETELEVAVMHAELARPDPIAAILAGRTR